MASIRGIKSDIDYLANEVISDCYMALYFNPEEKRPEIIAVIEETVDFRNEMIYKANHPAEKRNPSLVKKHYAQMRRDMMSRIDGLFSKLSEICK